MRPSLLRRSNNARLSSVNCFNFLSFFGVGWREISILRCCERWDISWGILVFLTLLRTKRRIRPYTRNVSQKYKISDFGEMRAMRWMETAPIHIFQKYSHNKARTCIRGAFGVNLVLGIRKCYLVSCFAASFVTSFIVLLSMRFTKLTYVGSLIKYRMTQKMLIWRFVGSEH